MNQPSYLTAVREAYDSVAVAYAELLRGEPATKPLDRAMLAAFAELVQGPDAGPVTDLGCGPGRITAHLRSLGLDAFGIDLSPEMVAVARRSHPELRFEEGSMTALDVEDGTLGGIVAWYSTVHTPPQMLPAVFAEFHRVLAPGGRLLLAFKAGDERRHLDRAYGHDLSLDVYWTSPRQDRRVARRGRTHRGRPSDPRTRRARAAPPGPAGVLPRPQARRDQRGRRALTPPARRTERALPAFGPDRRCGSGRRCHV